MPTVPAAAVVVELEAVELGTVAETSVDTCEGEEEDWAERSVESTERMGRRVGEKELAVLSAAACSGGGALRTARVRADPTALNRARAQESKAGRKGTTTEVEEEDSFIKSLLLAAAAATTVVVESCFLTAVVGEVAEEGASSGGPLALEGGAHWDRAEIAEAAGIRRVEAEVQAALDLSATSPSPTSPAF
jgi:hypothetical protein